jgi:non-specific serine/threonine protein kinase
MERVAQARLVYEAGSWEINASRRELRVGGVPVPLGARAFEIIEALVKSAGELVTKDELMERVWPGVIVEENTLHVHISAIRKALGADRGMLKTVSGRGYRLLGSWAMREEHSARELEASEPARTPAHPYLTNVPVAAAALVGREAAVRDLQDLLSAYRVVTLTGPGGIGKTVLAAEVARRLFPTFEGDVVLAESVSVSDPGLMASRVASVLGLRLGASQISPDAVARAIGPRKLLLVLDNCEQVVDEAAGLAETIVRLCPRTSLLVTSREMLRIDGEHVYRVAPLEVPDQDQMEAHSVLEHSAVQLFVARTKALRADFSAQEENVRSIAAICRRLDGIPLAIEFAAARAAYLGVRQVAERLDDRFALLTGGRRTALPRHRTLRAALDWSYELLPEVEQRLLRHLAVFPAGFTLEAAAAVMSDRAVDVTTGISNLISKSLVALDESVSLSRWRLLETIRAYALEKLGDSGEAENAARAHAEFFRDLITSAPPASRSDPAPGSLTLGIEEIDNLRAALEWSFSPNGSSGLAIALAAAAGPAFLEMSLLTECHRWTELAMGALDSQSMGTRLEMELRTSLGTSLMFTRGNKEEVQAAFDRGLELAEALADSLYQLRLLTALHIYKTRIGDFRSALALGERSVAVAKRLNDPASATLADWTVGVAHHLIGNQREALTHCESAMRRLPVPPWATIFQLGYDRRIVALVALARALWLNGQPDRAAEVARFTVTEAEALENPVTLCIALIYTTYVFLWNGDWPTAEAMIARTIAHAAKHSLGPYHAVGLGLRAELSIKTGDPETGIRLSRDCLETLRANRHEILNSVFATDLAEGLAMQGKYQDALATIEGAVAHVGQNGDSFDMPEMLRIKSEILEGLGRLAESEHCLARSLEWAHRQAAVGWELRAALSLARRRSKVGRGTEASALLAPVYAKFTEGFESADVREARRVLEELGGANPS